MTLNLEAIYDAEAEVNVIGAVLLNPQMAHAFELADEDFFIAECRTAWRALVSLIWEKHAPVDIVTLYDEIRSMGATKPDLTTLGDWASRVATAANVAYYARIVRRYATKRRVMLALQRQLEKLKVTTPEDVVDAVNTMQRDVIASCDVKAKLYSAAEVAGEVLVKLADEKGLLEEVVPTGLEKIDRRVGGILVGYCTLIAGRPSMGKSCLARILAANQARSGHHVGYISVEDKRQRILLALACKEQRVDIRRALMNSLTKVEHQRLQEGLEALRALPLHISDKRPLTPQQVCHLLRQMKAEYGIKAAYVDYWNRLHLPAARANSSRREEANEFVNMMSDTADQLGIALVIVAQLNRDSEKEQRRPRLSDLKETGGLEEIAESVILLHRESFYKPGCQAIEFGSSANEVEAIMAKWKTASPFRVVFWWAGRWLSITDEDPGDPDKKPTPTERQQAFDTGDGRRN